MTQNPIAIVGPGAVGGLLAVLLERSSVDVVAVARAESVHAIQQNGLSMRSAMFGDGTSSVRASTEIPVGARVIIATKAFAVGDVVASLARAEPREVVSLLNGIEHMDILRAQLIGVPLAGATIAVESTREAATVIDHRSGFLRLVVPEHAKDFSLVEDLRAAGLEVTVGGDEREVLWAKLRFLAPMALLTAFWREPLGAALEHDQAMTDALLAEVAQVASADGLATSSGQLADILAGFPTGMRSSLQVDIQGGNANELDNIGGAIIRRATAHEISTPVVERVVTALSRP
ncbi:MAG TPA: 2-dehydropantoate 2-reductase [Microbacteriaceae bacterium]